MSYSLSYLALLVITKNDINKRRRRFYALINPGTESFKVHPADKRFKEQWSSDHTFDSNYQKVEFKEKFSWVSAPKPMHAAYSKFEARQGYQKAQRDMKAMTKHMREVRKELGARLVWGDSGNIQAIEHEGRTYHARAPRYNERFGCNFFNGENEIEMLANHFLADQVLLDGGK